MDSFCYGFFITTDHPPGLLQLPCSPCYGLGFTGFESLHGGLNKVSSVKLLRGCVRRLVIEDLRTLKRRALTLYKAMLLTR